MERAGVVHVYWAPQTKLAGLAGIDLRRVRNHRGLKPFQLARLNGHSSIARQLGDPRTRRARGAGRRRPGETAPAGGADPETAPSPEALLTVLIQVGHGMC